MAQIRDYIDTRALAAIRINPRLEGMYEESPRQQMTRCAWSSPDTRLLAP
jgi:hypothetical protein